MKFEHLQGSIVAMITPFHEDGSVNFEVLTNLLERQIAEGTDAILTLGTTGEYSTMTHEEDAAVVAHTLKVVNGRVPVIVGSGSNCTATQLEKSVEYQNMGADALLRTRSTSPASSITSPAAPAAPSRSPWWRSSASTPTSPASRRPAAICPTP